MKYLILTMALMGCTNTEHTCPAVTEQSVGMVVLTPTNAQLIKSKLPKARLAFVKCTYKDATTFEGVGDGKITFHVSGYKVSDKCEITFKE